MFLALMYYLLLGPQSKLCAHMSLSQQNTFDAPYRLALPDKAQAS